MKKILIIILAVILILAGIIIAYVLNNSHTWRYREFLETLTDVPNGDAILKVTMDHITYVTDIHVDIDYGKLSQEQIVQLTEDISKQIDIHLPKGEDVTLIINDRELDLWVRVKKDDKTIFRVHGKRIKNMDETLEWEFKINEY